MAISNTPNSINFQSKSNFRFVLKRSPIINFFCTKANIPNLFLGTAQQPSPFLTAPEPGHKIFHGSFAMEFMVDENFDNYYELHDWITGIGLEESFVKYSNFSVKNRMSGERIKSDGSLIILNSARNQNFTVDYYDMFPIELSTIDFDTQIGNEEFITCTAKFMFRNFKINRP